MVPSREEKGIIELPVFLMNEYTTAFCIKNSVRTSRQELPAGLEHKRVLSRVLLHITGHNIWL